MDEGKDLLSHSTYLLFLLTTDQAEWSLLQRCSFQSRSNITSVFRRLHLMGIENIKKTLSITREAYLFTKSKKE